MNLISIKEKDGKVSPLIVKMFAYLNKLGYCAELLEAENYDVYQVQEHTYERVNLLNLQHSIKNWFLNPKNKYFMRWKGDYYNQDFNNDLLEDNPTVTPEVVLESVTKFGFGRIVNINSLVHLNPANFKRRKHTEKQAFFYFQNGFVEVRKDKIQFHKYNPTSEEKVSKKHIKPRNIEVIQDLETYKEAAPKGRLFYDYMQRVSLVPIEEGSEAEVLHSQDEMNYTVDETKLNYLFTLVGYLCHNFRKRGCTDFAAVFSDNEEGGSGKGLLIQAIKELVEVAEVDCKRKPELYDKASMSKDVQLKVYQDVESSFNLQDIYNETTEEGTIRRMRQDPIPVPYEEMWKVAMTANYVIKGNKSADLRRMRVFRLFPFFNDKRLIREFYQHSFFSNDWEESDWNYFYNIMFLCVQSWLLLEMNQSKVSYHDESYLQDKLNETYPPEFILYMEGLGRNTWFRSSDIFAEFIRSVSNSNGMVTNDYIKKYYASNQNFFSRQVSGYLKEKGFKVIKNHNRTEFMIK